jgi:hypothetical protein
MKIHFYRTTGSILLILIGALIWLSNLGVISIAWYRDWPVILIIIGALGLTKHLIRKRP